MENNNVLNVDNELHTFCLHFIYLKQINHTMHMFMDAWNNHPLSTENNLTPIQLWISELAGVSDSFDRDEITKVKYIEALL